MQLLLIGQWIDLTNFYGSTSSLLDFFFMFISDEVVTHDNLSFPIGSAVLVDAVISDAFNFIRAIVGVVVAIAAVIMVIIIMELIMVLEVIIILILYGEER